LRTGPQVTHVVRAGYLVSAGTMLVTPGVEQPDARASVRL